MNLLGLVLETVVSKLSEFLMKTVSNNKRVQVTDVRFSFVLPRRTIINHPLTYEYATRLNHDEALSIVKGQDDWHVDWVNSVELAFNIANNTASKSISIMGFRLDTDELADTCMPSYLEIPQGNTCSSDLLRFVTSLEMSREDGSLSFQRYNVEDEQLHFLEDPDYFSLASIPLKPGDIQSINLSIVSNKTARKINRAHVVYTANKRQHTAEIPLVLPIRIFPLHSIDVNQRYTYSYKNEPPFLRLEKDPAFPKDICLPGRWDNYPL